MAFFQVCSGRKNKFAVAQTSSSASRRRRGPMPPGEFSSAPGTTWPPLLVPTSNESPNSSDLCKPNAGSNVYTKDKQIAHDWDLPHSESEASIWPPCTWWKSIPCSPSIWFACRLCFRKEANLSVSLGSKVPLVRLSKSLEVTTSVRQVCQIPSLQQSPFSCSNHACPSMSRTCQSAYKFSHRNNLSTQALSSQGSQVLRATICLDVGYPTLHYQVRVRADA